MIKLDLVQGSAEWHQFRKNKIGASMIPAICGVNPYQSRNQLLKEFVTGETKAINDFTQRIFSEGHEWESVVLERINSDLENKYIPTVIQYDQDSLFFASLDGLHEITKMILEIKSTDSEKIWDEVNSGIVSTHFNFQIQWQLFVSGYNDAILAVVKKDTGSVRMISVHRDQSLIDKIYLEVKAF